jgi:hypothetical protein
MKGLIFLLLIMLSLSAFGQKPDTRKADYQTYTTSTNKPTSYFKWLSANNLLTPGDYLIKAKKQYIGGFVCELIAGGIIIVGESQYGTTTTYDITTKTSESSISGEGVRNTCLIGGGILALVGVGLDLSSFCNIGKAGICLNQNGIGIKVKF